MDFQDKGQVVLHGFSLTMRLSLIWTFKAKDKLLCMDFQ